MTDGWIPRRRDMLFGGLAAATGVAAYVRMPRRKLMLIGDGGLAKIVPDQVGDWGYDSSSGLVLPPPDQLAQLLYDQQVARNYASPDKLPIMLLMAYGSSQSGMLQIHRPEICYPASGFKLSGTRETQWEWAPGHTIPVRRFVARSNTRVEHVLYWTRIGDALPQDWAAQRIAVMRSSLTGFVPDGLLVRLSAVSENAQQAEEMVEGFARAMLNVIGPRGRRQLLGTHG